MFDELLAANRRYAEDFSLAGLAPPAAKGFALVTCMDTRIEPLTMLGLVPGDAKILRNAGARVTPDVLRGLVLAVNLLAVTQIAVMQHTKCALAGRDDAALRADMDPQIGARAASWELLSMPDPDKALLSDVELVRACELFPAGITVEGWRYSVETGLVDRVVRS